MKVRVRFNEHGFWHQYRIQRHSPHNTLQMYWYKFLWAMWWIGWGNFLMKATISFTTFIFYKNLYNLYNLYNLPHCSTGTTDRVEDQRGEKKKKSITIWMGVLLEKETLTELCCKTCVFAQVNSGTVSKEKIFF